MALSARKQSGTLSETINKISSQEPSFERVKFDFEGRQTPDLVFLSIKFSIDHTVKV